MIRLDKEKEKKKIKPLAPAPTITPIDASLNKAYVTPRGALKSNIVVSREDLIPAQQQERQTLQVRGALAPIKPTTTTKPTGTIASPIGLPSIEQQLRTATTAFQKPEPTLPTLPSPGNILKADVTRFQPDPNQKPIATTPYEKWYAENVTGSPIGKALTGLQGAGEATRQAMHGFADTATFGLTQPIERAAVDLLGDETIKGMYEASKIGTPTKVGEFAGYIPPGAAIERGIAKAAKPLLKGRGALTRGIATGAAVGAAEATGQELGDVAFRERTFDPVNIAVGAAVGGGLPVAFAGLGKAAQSVLNKYRKPIQPTLGLPAPKQRGNINTAQQVGTITPEYTFKLPDVSPSTINRAGNIKEARNDLKVIDDEIRQLNSSYERAIVDEYNYLKESMGQGKTSGMMIKDPVTGDVVDRVGFISNNPKWYQEISNASNNYKKPSNKELYDLARKRVDEGFQDEQGVVPSWKAENGFDESMSALQDVRNQIDSSLKELDPAMNLTDAKLISKELSFPSVATTKEVVQTPKPIIEQTSVAAEPKLMPAEKQIELDRIDAEIKQYKDNINRQVQAGYLDSQQANKQLKGNAMRLSADKRKIIQGDLLIPVEGGLTSKELNETIRRLKSNYAGKKVIVNGNEGTITKMSFGKVGVRFQDGTEKFFEPEMITSKVDIDKLIAQQKSTEQVIERATQQAETTPQDTPLTRPMVDDVTVVSGTNKGKSNEFTDELKFAETVRTSSQTDPELARILNDKKLTGTRTTDEANLQAANNMIDRNGAEKVADRIISKKGMLNSVENTAAQVLARYYSETGQLEKAIQIISKTAKSGRELGQAIQALSRWNKLDQDGAILLAERQLNRRTKDINAWKTLTPEQAAPVQTSAQGIEKVQDVQNIAREVVDMLANRKTGTPFTDAEKALLQNFNNTITEFDKTVRPILQNEKAARNQTIKEIGSIEPKKRTRDQVVNYLSAQEAKAWEALKRQRNMGIVSDQTNPVILYTIIGASKLASGAVKFSDWSESMIRSGITDRLSETYVKAVNKFRKENGLPTNSEIQRVINAAIKDKGMTEEIANSLRAMAAEIGFYADDVKLELTQDLQRAMQQIGRSTLGEKISTIQTAFMLLTGPTFLRNAFGNIGMILTEKLNKVASVPIDWAVSGLTGQRTIRFNPANQEKFWKNFVVGTVKEGWEGISTTGTLDSYDLQPHVFGEKNPLKYLSKTLGASLQGFDTAAYRNAYGDVVATYATNLGKAQGLSNDQIKAQMPDLIRQLDEKVLEIADEAGLYATFQDENILSKGAVSVKRGLSAITDVPMRKLREKGIVPEQYSTEGFGLGDIVLKFAKTPANLIMRGIDYSPLGIFRSLFELAPAVLGKGFDQRQFVLSLSRAITGSLGLTGLGFWLAKNNILTGAASQDRDVRSIQEQAGMGAYKVNLSALSRFITSGLNSDAAQPLEGDRIIDYAWLQPAAISLGMGVNAAEAMDKPLKPGEERSNMDIAKKAVLGGLGSILEMPLVTGVQKLTGAAEDLIKRQDFSGFASMVQGVPASFIPSIVGQVRTGMDNKQRETFDKRFFNAVWNQMKNKLPRASETLPVSYGSLGQERERIQGGESGSFYNYLTALLSPVKYTEYKVSPEAKIALDLLKESDDPNVLPRIGQKKITVMDPKTKLSKSIDLTNEQFSFLQKQMGDEISKALLKSESFFESSTPVNLKVLRIKDILNSSGSRAKNILRAEMGYRMQD